MGRCRRVLNRGFTLVETLVALTLLSLIAMALFAAVRAGLRITEAAERAAAANQDMRVISDLLVGTFTGSVPLTSVEGGKRLPHMKGDATSVALVIEAPARFRPGGLHEVVFEQVGRNQSSSLRMTRRLIHPDLLRKGATSITYERAEPDDERTLLDSATVKFSYFGRTQPRADPKWHDEWQGRWGTPLLLRAAIVQNGVSWPEVVARPQAQKVRFQHLRGGGRNPDDEPDDLTAPVDAPSGVPPLDQLLDPSASVPSNPRAQVCRFGTCGRSDGGVS